MTEAKDGESVATRRTVALSGRRVLLVLLAAGIGAVAFFRGSSWVTDRATDDLGFIPMDDPPGFRRLSLVGSTSGAINPFAGIGASVEVAETDEVIPEADFCSALFGRTSFQPGIAPVAFFSDYNCPNCELLAEDLNALAAEAHGGVHLRRHKWPILGAASETSARAAIAAGWQGAQSSFNRRLQRTSFALSEAYLRNVGAVRRNRPGSTARGYGERRDKARTPHERSLGQALWLSRNPSAGRRSHHRGRHDTDGDAGSAVQSRAIRRSPAGVRWSPIRGQAARLGSSQIEDDRDEDEETASQRRVQGEGGAGSAAGRS